MKNTNAQRLADLRAYIATPQGRIDKMALDQQVAAADDRKATGITKEEQRDRYNATLATSRTITIPMNTSLQIPANLQHDIDEALIVNEDGDLYLILKTEGEVVFSRDIEFPSDVDSILPNLTAFDLD